jgi:hypothetical protein
MASVALHPLVNSGAGHPSFWATHHGGDGPLAQGLLSFGR